MPEIPIRLPFLAHAGALGNIKADTIILQAQFGFVPDTSMPAAAETTVAIAQNLYGKNVAAAVRAAFQARGIL